MTDLSIWEQAIPDEDKDEFWGEPISTYTDAEAIEDGVIVDVSKLYLLFNGMPINRMTNSVWADLEPFVQAGSAAFGGNLMRTLRSMMVTKLRMAWYQGDIWHLPPRLWLIENEVGGWTVMYPEDY